MKIEFTISICFLFLILFILAGCYNPYSHFVVGSQKQQEKLLELFSLLENSKQEDEKFIIINQISRILGEAGYPEKQVLFLTSIIQKNPQHIYNAYYLYTVATIYEEMGASPFAGYYYERILKNYPDLATNNNSIHLICLQKLIKIVKNPENKIEYYKELVERFSDKIDDIGVIYFYLAQAYEAVGEWDLAIQKYREYLHYSGSEISWLPNTRKRIIEKINFYDSAKFWVVQELDVLVNAIKKAIQSRNANLLKRYMAQENFFTMSWEQDEYLESRTIKNSIGSFIASSNIKVADELDSTSNSQEAFLLTSNWPYLYKTWYLYFKRVDFLKDPEVNGGWEWAGIYFGKKL